MSEHVSAAARSATIGRMLRHSVQMAVLLAAGMGVSPHSAQAATRTRDEAAAQRSTEQWLSNAQTAYDAGRFPDAAKAWLQAAKLATDEQVVANAARTAYATHQLRATLQIAARWLELNPTSQDAHELAALSAIKLYQVDVAVAHLSALLQAAYITPAAGFMEWQDKIDAADAAAATAVFKQLVGVFPEVAEAHYQLARLAGQSDDLLLMQREAIKAQELAPYWSPAGLLLARAQLAMGQTDAALATAQAVVSNDDSIATRSDYAEVLINAGRAQDAVKLWRELEESDGDASPAIHALAILDYQLGNYQSSFVRFNRLLNYGKHISESIFYLGSIAERTGAPDEARQLYDRVQDGDYADAAQLRVASLILQSEGLTPALTFLQSYGAADPSNLLTSYKARAEMLINAGDQNAALDMLQQAIDRYPDVAPLRLSKAFQLVRMDKVRAALEVMRALQAERPEDPTILNAYGYTLVDHNKELQKGHDYIAAALKLSPDSAAVQDSMGWALYKLSRKEEALVFLQRAAQRMVDSELDLHLGEVLWSLGRKEEAIATWQAGVKRAPDDAALSERLKRAQKK